MDKYLTNSYLCAILLRWGTMIELVLEETTVWRGIRDGMAAQAKWQVDRQVQVAR